MRFELGRVVRGYVMLGVVRRQLGLVRRLGAAAADEATRRLQRVQVHVGDGGDVVGVEAVETVGRRRRQQLDFLLRQLDLLVVHLHRLVRVKLELRQGVRVVALKVLHVIVVLVLERRQPHARDVAIAHAHRHVIDRHEVVGIVRCVMRCIRRVSGDLQLVLITERLRLQGVQVQVTH